jgi:hypothetical protein
VRRLPAFDGELERGLDLSFLKYADHVSEGRRPRLRLTGRAGLEGMGEIIQFPLLRTPAPPDGIGFLDGARFAMIEAESTRSGDSQCPPGL